MLKTRMQGDKIELLAEKYLQQQGLKPIEQNYHSRFGEIDLILLDQETLVFVEVRFRANNQFGSAAETVDYHKQQKIIKTAMHFIQQHKTMQQRDCRFDVVSVTLMNHSPSIEWHKNAFQASAW